MVLQMLNLMECFDFVDMGYFLVDYLYLMIEVKWFVFEDRVCYVVDFVVGFLLLDVLLCKEYVVECVWFIDFCQVVVVVMFGFWLGGDIVYLIVVDEVGNMVLFIQSIYKGFGFCICFDGVGFLIQNCGEGFLFDLCYVNGLVLGK